MIHAPSLAIGAIIASITITVVMFGLNSITDEIGLSMEPTPKIQGAEPAKITMDTFVSNGSPVLGDSNAPITLVEFGDYQCHYSHVLYDTKEAYNIKK